MTWLNVKGLKMKDLQWCQLIDFNYLATQRFAVTGSGPSFERLGIGTSNSLLELAKEAAVYEQDFVLASEINKLQNAKPREKEG